MLEVEVQQPGQTAKSEQLLKICFEEAVLLRGVVPEKQS